MVFEAVARQGQGYALVADLALVRRSCRDDDIFGSLGMPLVKTVTNAGPSGKSLIDVELKVVSDQPAVGSTGRKATWLLSMLRSWTTG